MLVRLYSFVLSAAVVVFAAAAEISFAFLHGFGLDVQ